MTEGLRPNLLTLTIERYVSGCKEGHRNNVTRMKMTRPKVLKRNLETYAFMMVINVYRYSNR